MTVTTDFRARPGDDRRLAASASIVDRRTIAERMTGYGATHYLDFFNVIQGITLAVAGATLVTIADSGWSLPQLLMLAVALMATAVAHGGATAGAMLLNLYPGVLDLVLPMLLALAEFVLVLRAGASTNEIPLDWVATLVVWNLLAGALIYRVKRSHETGLYARDISETIDDYLRCLRRDCQGAFGTCAAICCGLVAMLLVEPAGRQTVGYLVLGLTLVAFTKALVDHGRSRAVIRAGIAWTREDEAGARRAAGPHD